MPRWIWSGPHVKPETVIMASTIDLLKRLNSHHVRYVLVGGMACVIHGSQVVTQDVEICDPPDPDNLSSLLGKGEVYQAKDQRLRPGAAIKVLPEEFEGDFHRAGRFQHAAKLLAFLNHPNIAPIHGLEESDGTRLLVTELIEGRTLGGRIKSCPIPIEEYLKLAQQIAEALDAAHGKGRSYSPNIQSTIRK